MRVVSSVCLSLLSRDNANHVISPALIPSNNINQSNPNNNNAHAMSPHSLLHCMCGYPLSNQSHLIPLCIHTHWPKTPKIPGIGAGWRHHRVAETRSETIRDR